MDHKNENAYNELDKLFQSRLKEQRSGSEEWNTPSDDVFEKAMAQIEPKKDRKPFFLWFLLPLFFLAMLGIILFQHQRVQDLEEKIYSLNHKDQVTLSNSNSETTENTNISDGNGLTRTENAEVFDTKQIEDGEEGPSIMKDIPSNQNITVANSVKPDILTTENSLHNRDIHTPKNNSFTLNQDELNNTSENLNEFSSPVSFDRNFETLNALSGIQSRLDYIHDLQAPPVLHQPHLNNEKGGGFYPMLIWSSELSTIHMTNLPVATFSLKAYDDYYLGYAFGVGLSQGIKNKWRLDYALTYHNQYNQSHFQNELLYDSSKEVQQTNGNVEYTADVQIVSPIGGHDEKVSLQLRQSQIQDQEKLINDTYIDQKYHSLGLSLVPNYQFSNNDKIDFSVGVGARLHYLFGFNETMYLSLYHDGNHLASEEISSDQSSMLNRIYGGLYGRADFKYNINDHYSVGLQSGYYRSLTSLKKQKSTDQAKTYLSTLNLNLTFSLKL